VALKLFLLSVSDAKSMPWIWSSIIFLIKDSFMVNLQACLFPFQLFQFIKNILPKWVWERKRFLQNKCKMSAGEQPAQ